MVKHIALFFDGTWNTHDAITPTNILRLSREVAPTDATGAAQVALYFRGVGTGQGTTIPGRLVDKLMGGILGWGLDDVLEAAYRVLLLTYVPGDQIHIFGYSRGAFTARSLAGLIRSCGILPRRRHFDLPLADDDGDGRPDIPDARALAEMRKDAVAQALARYRRRRDPGRGDPETLYMPDEPDNLEFRLAQGTVEATSDKEADWRAARGLPRPPVLKIAYLGVLDTVGALGVPKFFPFAPELNDKEQFHDHRLSRLVGSARHAVAVDERRETFPPTLWENVAALNRAALGLAPRADLSTLDRGRLPYRQEWFAGDHGVLGGGLLGSDRGLSGAPITFILRGAEKAGLVFHPGAEAAVTEDAHPMGAPMRQLPASIRTSALYAFQADRRGPDDPSDVATATLRRLADDPGYRPPTLARVCRKLGLA
jgi:hypothetical protein